MFKIVILIGILISGSGLLATSAKAGNAYCDVNEELCTLDSKWGEIELEYGTNQLSLAEQPCKVTYAADEGEDNSHVEFECKTSKGTERFMLLLQGVNSTADVALLFAHFGEKQPLDTLINMIVPAVGE